MQLSTRDLIVDLGRSAPTSEREKQLRRFARHFDWEPSDLICEDRTTSETATSHIVVEYGLQQSAVLSFLRLERPFATLSQRERQSILRISYNNAVDWHLLVDISHTSFLNNRLHEHIVKLVPAADDPDGPSARRFQKYTSARVRPQLQRVDDSIIQAVDYWRRRLSAAVKRYNINANLSALFNSLIFIRVLEDQASAAGQGVSTTILKLAQQETRTAKDLVTSALSSLGRSAFPEFLQNKQYLLSIFDRVSASEITGLVQDFYVCSGNPYDYDFSLISRHALSMIYEKYVSVVRESSDPQLSFFPLADAVSNRSLGTIYTPQFIARFFARYLNRNVPAAKIADSKILDPACGSGVFLRCIAEIFNDASAIHDDQARRELFKNLSGMDIDASAVDAAQLSLALLHVAYFGEFPPNLNIRQLESLSTLSGNQEQFSAIVANPPFVPWDLMSQDLRSVVTKVLGAGAKGKADAYQAFLKASMDSLEADGYLLFVLPQTFLSARAADSLRQELVESYSIEVIADLSNIVVFEDTGAYVVLLVARKRKPNRQYTTIVRCRDFPGQALNEALHGRKQENDFYQVFQIPQQSLSESIWRLLPSREMELVELLRRHVRLDAIADVRSGMVSGGRKLFTSSATDVPAEENELWPLLLTDRHMRYFSVPADSDRRMFFPARSGTVLEEAQVKDFPWTWSFLLERRIELEKRAAVQRDGVPWWRPHRLPDFVRRPKLVAPHVAHAPRFSFDTDGKFIVTQGPLIQCKSPSSTDNLEWYLLAILNSALVRWQIQRFSQRYARGYALLEPKTLREVVVPNPVDVPVVLYSDIVLESRRLWSLPKISEDDLETIDTLVLEAYGMPSELSAMIQRVF